MRDRLAERLLSTVMVWDSTQVRRQLRELQTLAGIKYDDYGNFGPGAKFIESLAGWLNQFPMERRQIALDFVLGELVFISETQMTHLITLVPTEVIASELRTRIAKITDIPVHRIRAMEQHADFKQLRRASLIIGASDGARLDQLRRASGLSHEQFLQGPAATPDQIKPLARELAKQLAGSNAEHAPFQHVFFVDDFSGSGRTLVRDTDEGVKGKLLRLRNDLADAAKQGYVVPDIPGTIVLYCASEQAEEHVRSHLHKVGLSDWSVRASQTIPNAVRVTDTNSKMITLSHEYYDPATEDEHKEGPVPIGYSDCALPLVLAHNTPNNSICPLWMDTRDKAESKQRKALFPRYERHHPDRP
jgi:hypothetical protein